MPILTRHPVAAGIALALIIVGGATSRAYAGPPSDSNQGGLTQIGKSVTTTKTTAGFQVTVDAFGTPTLSNGRSKGSQPRPAPTTPALPPGNSTCGLYTFAGEQRCQCATTDGPPLSVDYGECTTAPAVPKKPSQAQVLGAVRHATDELILPEGVPIVAPNPSVNEWNMIPVGFPIWLTTDAPANPDPIVTTQDGVTMTITAVRGTTRFDMGEARVQRPYVVCNSMTERKPIENPGNKKSPDCGYIYIHQGTYTVEATTTWHLTWTANGYTGTMDTTRTAAAVRPLGIGQLRSVIVSVGP